MAGPAGAASAGATESVPAMSSANDAWADPERHIKE